MARLASGKVAPAQFDWAAMAFDFGPSGRARLAQVAKSGSAEMRTMAMTALKAEQRWGLTEEKLVAGPPPATLSLFPRDATIPPELGQWLLHGRKGEEAFCKDGGACRVYPQSDGATFVVFMDGCANVAADQRNDLKVRCTRTPGIFVQTDGKWANVYDSSYAAQPPVIESEEAIRKRESEALDRGDVKVVPVEKRQLVVGGKPTGAVF
jgi:hypothetical protein